MKEIADNHTNINGVTSRKISVSDIVIAWALQEGAVVIPRSSKAYHIKSNAKFIQNHSDDINNSGTGTSQSQISNYIILSEEEMTRIRDLDGTLD